MITLPTHFPVTCHTNYVDENSIFVAIPGYTQDGAIYIQEAIARGAREIVIEHTATLTPEQETCIAHYNVTIHRVDNARKALAHLSAQKLSYPAHHLTIIGVTGTKGKTTTVHLVAHILRHAGYRVASLSTVKNYIHDVMFDAPLTTAQPDYLHQFFHVCRQEGITHVVLEVAAQALSLSRVEGIFFDTIIFTNFSPEHGEFYPTLDEYFNAKKSLLQYRKLNARTLINSDDEMLRTLVDIHTISIGTQSAQQCYRFHGTSPCLIQAASSSFLFSCPALIGTFNCYNLMMSINTAQSYGIPETLIQEALNSFPGVPGRMQFYPMPNGSTAIIDYAHNPASYKQILSTIRSMTDHLILVFGCGGARDRLKRPIMGEIAARHADALVLTSDNPRHEDPHAIIADICAGIPAIHQHKVSACIIDREKAIQHAYGLTYSGSCMVILGKGVDNYQEIKGIKTLFSDKAVIEQLK
jgi:UDP-N-acetylmuramyl-tripeptide synthetase